MPRDCGGIGRLGKKHLKPSVFDIRRKLKLERVKLKLRGSGSGGSGARE